MAASELDDLVGVLQEIIDDNAVFVIGCRRISAFELILISGKASTISTFEHTLSLFCDFT